MFIQRKIRLSSPHTLCIRNIWGTEIHTNMIGEAYGICGMLYEVGYREIIARIYPTKGCRKLQRVEGYTSLYTLEGFEGKFYLCWEKVRQFLGMRETYYLTFK